MKKAFVLMAAMPPTIGHLNLIQFASELSAATHVIVCTQPGEPFTKERFYAVEDAVAKMDNSTAVWDLHRTIEQNADAPGFWPMWEQIMYDYGFRKGDYIVSSEKYGQILAEKIGGQFMPYDLSRSITPIRATVVREDVIGNFPFIIPEFQPNLMMTTTIMGAESTGKTTLAKSIDGSLSRVLPEWARPYLESFEDKSVTLERMNAIWAGQKALQKHGKSLRGMPWIIQDTDLFSTLGYARLHPELDVDVDKLAEDAVALKSDLYLITTSNIPFEPDPLRFGIDKRESNDLFWVDLAIEFKLNYFLINKKDKFSRLYDSEYLIHEKYHKDFASKLNFRRAWND